MEESHGAFVLFEACLLSTFWPLFNFPSDEERGLAFAKSVCWENFHNPLKLVSYQLIFDTCSCLTSLPFEITKLDFETASSSVGESLELESGKLGFFGDFSSPFETLETGRKLAETCFLLTDFGCFQFLYHLTSRWSSAFANEFVGRLCIVLWNSLVLSYLWFFAWAWLGNIKSLRNCFRWFFAKSSVEESLEFDLGKPGFLKTFHHPLKRSKLAS